MTLLLSFQEKEFRFAPACRSFEARPDARIIRDLIRFGRLRGHLLSHMKQQRRLRSSIRERTAKPGQLLFCLKFEFTGLQPGTRFGKA
jgi:hypothetical protein